MKRLTENMAFIIIILFSFFGLYVFSTLVHELSHVYDYKDINKTDEKISIYVLPMNDTYGKYNFYYDDSEKSKINGIKEWTEFKAYSIEVLILLIYMISLLIIIIKRLNKKKYYEI